MWMRLPGTGYQFCVTWPNNQTKKDHSKSNTVRSLTIYLWKCLKFISFGHSSTRVAVVHRRGLLSINHFISEHTCVNQTRSLTKSLVALQITVNHRKFNHHQDCDAETFKKTSLDHKAKFHGSAYCQILLLRLPFFTYRERAKCSARVVVAKNA